MPLLGICPKVVLLDLEARNNQSAVHNPRGARTLFQKQMDAGAEICNSPWAKLQAKRGTSDNMIRGIKNTMGRSIESAYPS